MAMRRIGGVSAAFSLIELMVAIVVLILILTLVLEMFSGVARIATRVGEGIGINKSVGAFFDRLNFDWKAMPRTGGSHPVFEENVDANDNDRFRFYSEVNMSDPATRLSLCQFGVFDGSGTAGMGPFHGLRTAQPVDWSSGMNPGTPPSIDNATPQPIGEGIFRMELSFFLDDGTIFNDVGGCSVDPKGKLLPKTGSVPVRALIVAVAALDEKTTGILTQDQLDKVRSLFRDTSSADGKLPVEGWRDRLNSLTGAEWKPVRESVRFDERFYYLD